ncbi:MAG: DUF1552 domain-containing protein [Bythopirellula sp.]
MSRRTLLRGAGTAVALPLLDAMIPAMTAVAKTAAAPQQLRRLSYVYMPMGFNPADWTPAGPTRGEVALGELPSSLQSLQAVQQHVAVLTGMELQNAYPGSHATSNAAFLSAARAKRTESSDYYLGATVDQIAVKHIGQQTQLPSLELAIDIMTNIGQCDNGYACVYQNNLSWSAPTSPLPAEAHPRLVFENLFGDGGSPAERHAAIRERASLLDSLTEEMKRLQLRLGAADRNRVDDYLESVREVERRIQLAEANVRENTLPDLDRPIGVPAEYADHARLMFDLQVLAFQGDITRITTFQLAREASTRTYPEIGVPDPHHPITHHGGNTEKLAKVSKVNQFHVSLFADYLEKLAAIPEGDGTLLDHSLLMYGSGMGDGNAHDHTNLPVIVAGGAAGKMRGGRHLVYDQPTPLANLHLTLLNKVGVPLETFADSNGRVDALFDPVTL